MKNPSLLKVMILSTQAGLMACSAFTLISCIPIEGSSEICFYSEEGFSGSPYCVVEHANNVEEFRSIEIIADISSVQILAPDHELILYTQPHQGGDSIRIQDDVASLADYQFDDLTASYVLVKKGAEEPKVQMRFKKYYVAAVNEPIQFHFEDLLGDFQHTMLAVEWSFGDDSEDSTEFDTEHTYDLPGFYSYGFGYTPTHVPNSNNGFLGTVAISPAPSSECPLPIYQKGKSYKTGDQVQLGGAEFTCSDGKYCSKRTDAAVPPGDGLWGPSPYSKIWAFTGYCPIEQKTYEPRNLQAQTGLHSHR